MHTASHLSICHDVHGLTVSPGTGSTQVKKDIIKAKLANREFFDAHHREFKREFFTLADDLGQRVQVVTSTHALVIKQTIDMLRNDNVALESDSDPEFRMRLAEETERIAFALQDVQRAVE